MCGLWSVFGVTQTLFTGTHEYAYKGEIFRRDYAMINALKLPSGCHVYVFAKRNQVIAPHSWSAGLQEFSERPATALVAETPPDYATLPTPSAVFSYTRDVGPRLVYRRD